MMSVASQLESLLIKHSDPIMRLDAWLFEHFDVGKRCGATSQPCGDACVPRKRNGKKVQCKKTTSRTAQEYNQKQRSAKAKDLLEARVAKRTSKKSVEAPQKVAVKPEPKPKAPKSKPKQVDDTPVTKVHSIKTQKDFENLALHTLDKLNREEDLGGLVPIYKLRRAMGELVPRDKFNEFLQEMQANDDVTLQGGSVEDSALDKIQDSVRNGLGKLRTYALINPDAIARVKDRKTLDEKLKDRPELDELGTARQLSKGKPLSTQKDFDSVVIDAAKRLNNEFSYENAIPISKLRSALGDRVSAKDFDTFLQSSERVSGYEEAGVRGATPDVEKGALIRSFDKKKKHYVKFTGLK